MLSKSHRGATPIFCAGIVCAVAMIGCVSPRGSSAKATTPQVAAGVPVDIVDTLAQRLSALEIERLHSRTIYERWAPASLAIDERIAAAQEQLLSVSVDGSAPRFAMQTVLKALDARQASLAVRHRELLITYVPAGSEVANVATEERLVEQRRAELRMSLLQNGESRKQR